MYMSATGFTRSGGMGYNPYAYNDYLPFKRGHRLSAGIQSYSGGLWQHNPSHVAMRAVKGAGMATVIGAGNYMTRGFRQKPLNMLQVATHEKRMFTPKQKIMAKIVIPKVDIPTVTSRRTKSYPKNKVLLKSIRPMAYSTRRTYKPKTRRSFKKATNRKNKKTFKSKSKAPMKVLTKQVKQIQKSLNSINSTHTYKTAETGTIKSLIGRCNHSSYGFTASRIETFTANLRYYDPAAPATLVTADPNTGTYARDISIKNVTMKLLLRNNYQVPARVKVYLCKVKNDTNDNVITTYTNSITDQVINAGVDETDALIYLTDIERVKENWAIDCVVDKVLEPSQEVETSHSTGEIAFDPSHLDLNSDIFQKRFKSFQFVVRLEGVLGHDTAVATEQTLLLAGVDTQVFYRANIQYNSGGADLDDIYIAEPRIQSFTNGGVCSLKPIADNIAYSVA